VPGYPNWLATTEINGDRVKITDISTGDTICKFGETGPGHGEFSAPWGLTITADGRFVIVADMGNARVQVLELVIGDDRLAAHLEQRDQAIAIQLKFVCTIGCAQAEVLDRIIQRADALPGGITELRASPGYTDWRSGLRADRPEGALKRRAQLSEPSDVALQTTRSNGVAHQTILVTDSFFHRVLHFELDGTFIGTFAGGKKGKEGSGQGEFNDPRAITVLPSGEVAVADFRNHRVQIFGRKGEWARQFGTEGGEDGQFLFPGVIACDGLR
jgi:DNA-binding beta-propeller fold protein YncE